jgi:putative phage-type endonuclease
MKNTIRCSPIEIKLEQRSKEWHEFRKGKLGASMASSIMGINPYKTPLELYHEIKSGYVQPVNPAMQLGIDAEDQILAEINEKLGSHFKPAVFQHEKYPWIIASLDGWDGFSHVEIKVCSNAYHSIAQNKCVPLPYYAQLSQHMMVMGTEEALYASAKARRRENGSVEVTDLIILRKDRDQEHIDLLESKLLWFKGCVDNDQPPDPIDRDWITLVDPVANEKARELREIELTLKQLEDKKTILRSDLLAMINHPCTKVGGMKIQKVVRKGAVDYSKIKELNGVDLDAFRKEPVESWRITHDQ